MIPKRGPGWGFVVGPDGPKKETMKLKLDADGHVVVQDDRPVYDDNGRDVVFDYDFTIGTISRLNSENKSYREKSTDLETRLKAFEGIEDPVAAREAVNKLKDVDLSKMIHLGKLDEVKVEAEKVFNDKLRAVTEQYKPLVQERDNLRQSLHKEKIGGSFSRSKFISDKLVIPHDIVEAMFGGAFAIEEDRVVAKDRSGNHIYSRARPGEIANFDEALEELVERYPNRDTILKGSGASGSGASGGTGMVNGKRTMTRAAFDAMDAMERHKAIKEVVLVD